MKDGYTAYMNGLCAEDAAAALYGARAGVVLDRRARTQAGEIDLIVEEGADTVFVEVKARRSHAAAAHAISRRQSRRIGAAALSWLDATGRDPCAIRFDVVLVNRHGETELVENAFAFDD